MPVLLICISNGVVTNRNKTRLCVVCNAGPIPVTSSHTSYQPYSSNHAGEVTPVTGRLCIHLVPEKVSQVVFVVSSRKLG